MPNTLDFLTPEELEAFGLSERRAKSVSSSLRHATLGAEGSSKEYEAAEVVKKEVRDSISTNRNSSHKDQSRVVTNQKPFPTSYVADKILSDSSASVIYSNDKVYPGASPVPVEEDHALNEEGYQCLLSQHPTSFELVSFYDRAVASNQVILHPWQLEESERLCNAGATSKNPFKYVLCAANGSGKDAFVIAPFAVWFALCKIKSLCIITSSSGVQLTAQTENYIKSLCEKVNAFWGQSIFRIRQRFIRCNLSGSEIRLFATDEAGKAEGYHPLEPGAEMCIIENEAKSISLEINQALRRCNGYNYWLKVSTPGEPHGHFYDAFNNWSNTRRVTYYDCPHLSEVDFQEDLRDLGETSPLVRSKWFAEFTSIGGQIVITQEALDRCLEAKIKKCFQDWPLRIGIDYAKGGDELVIVGTKGNSLSFLEAFRETDATFIADRIELILRNYVEKSHDYIFADDGGVGSAITDILVRRGWNINRILNQSPAIDKKRFGNRGAEMWFRVARFFQERLWSFENMNDKLLQKQLSNRYYKQQETQGRIFLQSKKEAKVEGRPSPDRADAFILSLTGLTVSDFLQPDKDTETEKIKRTSNRVSEAKMIAQYEDSAYDIFNNNVKHKNAHSSLAALM